MGKCLKDLQVMVVMPQFGLRQRFVGFSFPSFVLDEVLVPFASQKTKVDKALQVFVLIVS